MKLLQIKTRGLGSILPTDWLTLKPHLNILTCKNDSYGIQFLKALETINPPFSCREKTPFAHLPREEKQNGYTKRISPHKRTISLGVFEAPPRLVTELGEICDSLYETDRLEVGRRLDYSRWLNFIEISSSTRWKEISRNFEILADALRPSSPEIVDELHEYIENLAPGDRIKNNLMEQLAAWLRKLPPLPDKNMQSTRALTQTAVSRAELFHRARQMVYPQLPLFVLLEAASSIETLLSFITQAARNAAQENSKAKNIFIQQLNKQITGNTSDQTDYLLQESAGQYVLSYNALQPFTKPVSSELNQLKTGVALASAISKVLFQTEPILLFAKPDKQIREEYHPDLAEFLLECAEKRQCLCSLSNNNLFNRKSYKSTGSVKNTPHYLQVEEGIITTKR